MRHQKLLNTVWPPAWEEQTQQKLDKDQRGRRQHSLQIPSPVLLFTISYWELWSLPPRQLPHTCPTLFPTFKDKHAANNLVYIRSKHRGLQEHLCLPALPSWYSYAEPSYTSLYFFQISVPFLSKLICGKVFSITWCYNTSTVILISNIFIPLHLWQAPGSVATNIPVTNELLSAPDFTIQLLACGLWSNLNLYNPCIGSTPSSNNSNNTNKQCKTPLWPQVKNTGQLPSQLYQNLLLQRLFPKLHQYTTELQWGR